MSLTIILTSDVCIFIQCLITDECIWPTVSDGNNIGPNAGPSAGASTSESSGGLGTMEMGKHVCLFSKNSYFLYYGKFQQLHTKPVLHDLNMIIVHCMDYKDKKAII